MLQRAELLQQLGAVLVRLEVEEVSEDAGLGHGDRAGVLHHDHGAAWRLGGAGLTGPRCTVYCLLSHSALHTAPLQGSTTTHHYRVTPL